MKGLSLRAKIYIFTTITAGLALAFWHLVHIDWQSPWLLVLASLAAVGQVFKVEGTTQQSSYNVAWMVYGFSFLLLGAPAALFVILVAHLVEWAWYKYPWYIQWFNIASYVLAISAAGGIYNWINPSQPTLTLTGALGVLISLAAFTLLNHLLIGLVIWLARGQDLLQSGVFGFISLIIDYTLIGLGTATAMLWLITPAAAILTVIPLYLIYSTLRVPALERQTEIDSKTQLYNARYFSKALEKELNRAERFERPLTVAIGDMDLLRNINNTYGHLAGDVVLCSVAQILQESFRGYDVVARFGGEEFAILLPETTPEHAYPRIEAVRTAIETTGFEVSTSVTPIKVTMSFGIAGRSSDSQTPGDIIHNADVALYDAKLNGRNLTSIYSNEGVAALFRLTESGSFNPGSASSIERTPMPIVNNPLRERAAMKSSSPEKPLYPVRNPKPAWLINTYVGIVAVVAVGLINLIFRPVTGTDWYGLAAFAFLVLLTEGLSVDIYVRDTSVSISAAPFIGGVLLYGPIGVLVLSILLAGTAWIKSRSPINRFLFNAGNHMIASSIVVGLVVLINLPFNNQPALVQVSLALIAGGIVFLSSTALLSGVLSLSQSRPVYLIWGEQFRWLWPYYLAFGVSAYGLVLGYNFAGMFGILAFVVPILALRYSQVQYIDHTKAMVNQLRANNVKLEKQSEEISALNEELLFTLSTIIDMRDPFTLGHSKHVTRYAVLIAKELGLPLERIELIRRAGLLHDIGKLGIPEKILFKPGSLTSEEYRVIKQHATLGAEIVEACHSLHSLIPPIRHHHERFDGLGYPDGLLGYQIPLEARILELSDALEAMASDRPYRKGFNLQEIIQEITNNAGTQFDPVVVSAFLKVLKREGECLIINSGRDLVAEKHAQVLRVA